MIHLPEYKIATTPKMIPKQKITCNNDKTNIVTNLCYGAACGEIKRNVAHGEDWSI